jgi:hypothetical protein
VVVPGLAVTVHVVPLPVTLVTLAPVSPDEGVRLKFDAFNPVTTSLNVTVQESVAAPDGFGPARLIETTFGAIV